MVETSKAAFGIFIITLHFFFAEGLLCYRCDSQYNEDCAYYPAPMSSYEDCNDKPQRTFVHYKGSEWVKDQEKPAEPKTQPIYIRYRYHLCPILEKTIKQYVSFADFCDERHEIQNGPIRMPSPMDGVSFVCGKAVTHGPDGARIRRGCTPDLFLNGTNACVTHSPQMYGDVDVACFCTSDFCNHGSPSRFQGSSRSTFLLSFTTVALLLVLKYTIHSV